MIQRSFINHRAAFCLLAALLAVANFIAFYPGIMSYDSTEQLGQAMQGVYTDHHPPIMAAWWHMLLALHGGPAPMLAFHLMLYWGAVILLGLIFMQAHPRLVWLFAVLWFLPPVMGMTGAIWKDTGMTVSWLFAAALLIYHQQRESRPGFWGIIALTATFFYGFAVRYNAWTGAWPLLFWLVTLYAPPWAGTVRRIVLSLLLLAVLGSVSWVVNERLTALKTYIGQELLLQDIGCLSLRTGRLLYPPYITEHRNFSLAELKRKNPPGQPRVYFKYDHPDFYTTDPEEVALLEFAWQRSIVQSPQDYLACRWHIFNDLYRLGMTRSRYPYELRRESLAETSAINRVGNQAFTIVASYLNSARDGVWNWPYIWSFLAGLLCIVSGFRLWANRGIAASLDGPIFYLTLSGLFYLGAYFFIAWSGDMRYLYWSIMSTALALILALFELADGVKKRKPNGIISRVH